MYEISNSGVFHWTNIVLWTFDFFAWIAYLGGVSTFWKHDKDSVALGIVWFSVWLHFAVLVVYVPIIFLGTRFYSHAAHTFLIITFVVAVIVCNSARALTKAGFTGTLQKAAKVILGSAICICVLAGTKLITMTGEIEAFVDGSAARAPVAAPAKADAESNPTADV